MMLYLCAPFCKKCVAYSPCILILLSFVAMVLGVIAEQWQGDAKGMQLLFFTRVPIFCIGMCFGRWIKEGIILRNSVKWFLYILSFCGFIILVLFFYTLQPGQLWEWGLYWLLFICIVPGFCIGLSGGFERMGKESFPVRVFSFFGSISLELYLIHLKLFEYSDILSRELHLSRVIYLLCVFVLSIPVSWGLSRLLRPKSCFR